MKCASFKLGDKIKLPLTKRGKPIDLSASYGFACYKRAIENQQGYLYFCGLDKDYNGSTVMLLNDQLSKGHGDFYDLKEIELYEEPTDNLLRSVAKLLKVEWDKESPISTKFRVGDALFLYYFNEKGLYCITGKQHIEVDNVLSLLLTGKREINTSNLHKFLYYANINNPEEPIEIILTEELKNGLYGCFSDKEKAITHGKRMIKLMEGNI